MSKKRKNEVNATEIDRMIAMASKLKNENEVRAFIEDMRADGFTEDYILTLVRNIELNRKEVEEMNKKNYDFAQYEEERNNPLNIDRKPLAEGYYSAILKRYRTSKDGRLIEMEIQLTDWETMEVRTISQRYTERFYDTLYRNMAEFYHEHQPRTLSQCLELMKNNEWYCQVKHNGTFVNIYPLSQQPLFVREEKNDFFNEWQ